MKFNYFLKCMDVEYTVSYSKVAEDIIEGDYPYNRFICAVHLLNDKEKQDIPAGLYHSNFAQGEFYELFGRIKDSNPKVRFIDIVNEYKREHSSDTIESSKYIIGLLALCIAVGGIFYKLNKADDVNDQTTDSIKESSDSQL